MERLELNLYLTAVILNAGYAQVLLESNDIWKDLPASGQNPHTGGGAA